MRAINERRIRAVLVLVLAAFLAACSSAPKKTPETTVRRNRAAELAKLGDGALGEGKTDYAISLYGLSIKENRAVDNLEGEAQGLLALGNACRIAGRDESARDAFRTALDRTHDLGSPLMAAQVLVSLAELDAGTGDLPAAKDGLAQARAALDAAGNSATPAGRKLKSRTGARLSYVDGLVRKADGDLDGAWAAFSAAVAVDGANEDWAATGTDRYMMALMRTKQGAYREALDEAAAALANDKKAENSSGIVQDLLALGAISVRLGENAGAYGYFRRAYETAKAAERPALARKALERLVETAEALGHAGERDAWQKLLDAAPSGNAAARTLPAPAGQAASPAPAQN